MAEIEERSITGRVLIKQNVGWSIARNAEGGSNGQTFVLCMGRNDVASGSS
jgi:hypothetical protein